MSIIAILSKLKYCQDLFNPNDFMMVLVCFNFVKPKYFIFVSQFGCQHWWGDRSGFDPAKFFLGGFSSIARNPAHLYDVFMQLDVFVC